MSQQRGPEQQQRYGMNLGLGMLIGSGAGIAIGAAFHQIVAGIAIGAIFGIAIGGALARRAKP